jgi:mRNA interferase YafQ
MSYTIAFTNQFKKEAKLCKKRNYDISLLEEVMLLLRAKGELPAKYKPHILSGNYNGYWECHIKSDWLLIWLQDEKAQEITLVRTGTHSDLF